MFSEKTRLTERENPFYGSYKEQSFLEEAHWQNRKKRQQLVIVVVVVAVLVALAIGITLAITLPSLTQGALDPPNPKVAPGPSASKLSEYAKAGVSTDAAECSEIGKQVLQDMNGTAVDAAVAAALCLGVVSPHNSGIGGGLFMTVYKDGEAYAINARERAPANVDPLAYSDDPSAAIEGGTAVGVPGELAGLYEAHAMFGKVDWAKLVDLAINLADSGFNVSEDLAAALKVHSEKIKSDAGLRSEFVNSATGEPYQEGDVITRKKLAETLRTIRTEGATAFYNGTLAGTIAEEVAAAGGPLTGADLAQYMVTWQEPFSHTFANNLTIHGPLFPSSGPIVAMALLILEGYGKKHSANMTVTELAQDSHQLAEVLKFAAAHRGQVADPEFADLSQLLEDALSPQYANELRSRIQQYRSSDDPSYYGAVFSQAQDEGTTHVSVIGPDGDAVSLTTTVNTNFGAGFMGEKTGIIYNNQLADFSVPNTTDVYGLLPNSNNFIEPGKVPASSMAPLIFLNNQGKPVLATGAAGGSDILPALISTTWRMLYRNMDIKKAIDQPRFRADLNPTRVVYEYGLPAPIVLDMERRGHKMTRLPLDAYVGNVNSVCRTKLSNIILANADYRGRGDSAGF